MAGVHLQSQKCADEDAGPKDEPKTKEGDRHGETHVRKTPKTFKDLFDFADSLRGLSFKHDREKKFCQVVYPCCSALLIQMSIFLFVFTINVDVGDELLCIDLLGIPGMIFLDLRQRVKWQQQLYAKLAHW